MHSWWMLTVNSGTIPQAASLFGEAIQVGPYGLGLTFDSCGLGQDKWGFWALKRFHGLIQTSLSTLKDF